MSHIEPVIYQKLNKAFSPQLLVITNDSHKHAGHAGIAGDVSGETHFTIRIVSAFFAGKPRVKRHQAIYTTLEAEMNNPIHALSIEAYTPAEFEAKDNSNSV